MITEEQVKKIAELSYLNLSEDEIRQNSEELSRIIDFFKILKKVDTDGVEPLLCTAGFEDIMREDKAKQSGIETDIVAIAPGSQREYIKTKSFSNL